jgi:NADH-quinone oxidoreductase subunit K
VLSAALFVIGMIGVMVRRNVIVIFMSIELMLNAVNINLVAFSQYQLQNAIGQVFAIFVIASPAAEAAVGLGHHPGVLPQQGDAEHRRDES